MKKILFNITLAFLLWSANVLAGLAQNVGINSTGAPANASAVLDISSTTSGLLVPRMTTVQMNAIAAPAISLVIYNTTVNCFEFWTGSVWVTMTCVCVSPSPNTPSGVGAPAINTCGNIYSIPVVPGATGYMWSITPSGGGTSIGAGQGTATVNICFGPALQTYTICVYDSSLTCAKSPSSCLSVTSTNCLHGTINFSYTGAMQTWTVPACITQVTVTLKGGSGGNSATSGSPLCNLGGEGGTVSGVLPVVPGVLNIFVGGAGTTPVSPFGAQALGGWNGGGLGGFNGSAYAGGGGGGMTDIRVGGVAWANIVVCAGAGGGAAYNYGCGGYDQGGPGGGAIGGCGEQDLTFGCPPTYASGGGGSQVAGGAGGLYAGYCLSGSGGPGIGGNGCVPTEDGGGGGAGYYGGGAGCWEGGGGGSSYVTGLSSVTANTQGTNLGNGSLSLTY